MTTFDSERAQEVLRGRFYTLRDRGSALLEQLEVFEADLVALRADTVDIDKQGEIDARRAAFVAQVKTIFTI